MTWAYFGALWLGLLSGWTAIRYLEQGAWGVDVLATFLALGSIIVFLDRAELERKEYQLVQDQWQKNASLAHIREQLERYVASDKCVVLYTIPSALCERLRQLASESWKEESGIANNLELVLNDPLEGSQYELEVWALVKEKYNVLIPKNSILWLGEWARETFNTVDPLTIIRAFDPKSSFQGRPFQDRNQVWPMIFLVAFGLKLMKHFNDNKWLRSKLGMGK